MMRYELLDRKLSSDFYFRMMREPSPNPMSKAWMDRQLVQAWLEQYRDGVDYIGSGTVIRFMNPDAALAFRLRWC